MRAPHKVTLVPPVRLLDPMLELDMFVVAGHEKVIGYWRWLRDTAKSNEEREAFDQRMIQEQQAVDRYVRRKTGRRNAGLINAKKESPGLIEIGASATNDMT